MRLVFAAANIWPPLLKAHCIFGEEGKKIRMCDLNRVPPYSFKMIYGLIPGTEKPRPDQI